MSAFGATDRGKERRFPGRDLSFYEVNLIPYTAVNHRESCLLLPVFLQTSDTTPHFSTGNIWRYGMI